MSEENQTQSIAAVRSYADLRKAIIKRRHELGWSQLETDYRAGLQDAYTGKLESGVRHFGDMSLGVMLETLGLEMIVRPSTDHCGHQGRRRGVIEGYRS